MANTTRTAKAKGKSTNGPPADGGGARPEGETISGYFRKFFAENPKLLKERSNDELLRRWLADHPGHSEVPEKVKKNLANVKSVLRKKRRKKGGSPPGAEPTAVVGALAKPKSTTRGLETLEEQIDDCLSLAKRLDREGLGDVIALLRRARNGVVWMTGQ
jgi:hypothetical protein